MKKLCSLVLGLLLLSLSVQAQQYDVLDQVARDARKSWGMKAPIVSMPSLPSPRLPRVTNPSM